jgi:toxin ParE1/3/4
VRRVVLHPEAERELLREVACYSKGRAGSDVRFLDAVQAATGRAAQHPLAGAPTFGESRSVLVKGFPFGIVFRHTAEVLKVTAISPHRKRPLYRLARRD